MYRSHLMAAGDPVYRAALAQGDPIFGLGALIRPALGLARRFLPKAAGLLRKGVGVIRRHPTAVGVGTTVGIGLMGMRGGRTGQELGMRAGRRMNVANPRALRRAIRRVTGFGKLVKRSKSAVRKAASAVGATPRTTKKKFRR